VNRLHLPPGVIGRNNCSVYKGLDPAGGGNFLGLLAAFLNGLINLALHSTADASVVHQDVETGTKARHFEEHRCDGGGVRHLGCNRMATDLSCYLLGILKYEVIDDNGRPLFREPLSHSCAKSPRGSRYKCGFSL
jgi:hypothetical protein